MGSRSWRRATFQRAAGTPGFVVLSQSRPTGEAASWGEGQDVRSHGRDWKVGSGEVEQLHVAPVSPVWKTELYFLASDYKGRRSSWP
jgi:hypothetical protein